MATNSTFKNKAVAGIDKIVEEFDLDKGEVVKAFSRALTSAYRKRLESSTLVLNSIIDDEKLRIFRQYQINTAATEDESYNEDYEIITLSAAEEIARKIKYKNELKEFAQFSEEIDLTKELSRSDEDDSFSFAKNLKRFLDEEIKKLCIDSAYKYYQEKCGQLVTGVITEIPNQEPPTYVIVKVPKIDKEFKIKAISKITRTEQESGKTNTEIKDFSENVFLNCKVGKEIDLILVRAEKNSRPDKPNQLELYLEFSRIDRLLIQRYFEKFIPEFTKKENGISDLEVMGVSRYPGVRTKIAIKANAQIDPIGSCVGRDTERIRNITDRIAPEKIDIFKYEDDPKKLIINSLRPGKIIRVVDFNEKDKKAIAVVGSDKDKSIAIGKDGVNVKLSKEITGYQIEVETETALDSRGFLKM